MSIFAYFTAVEIPEPPALTQEDVCRQTVDRGPCEEHVRRIIFGFNHRQRGIKGAKFNGRVPVL